MVNRNVTLTEFMRFIQALVPKTAYACIGDGTYTGTPANLGRWIWSNGQIIKIAYDNVGSHPLSLKPGYKWVNWGAPFPGTNYTITITTSPLKHYRRQTDMSDQPRQPPDWNKNDIGFPTWTSMIIPRWWDSTWTTDWVKAYVNTGVINHPSPAERYQSKVLEIRPLRVNDLGQNVTPFYKSNR